MRTTKETRHDFGTWCAQQGTLAADPILHDLADAVEWLIDITSVQCPVCCGEDGDHAEACELGAFLRKPQPPKETP